MYIVALLPILIPLGAGLVTVCLPIRVCRTDWYRLARLACLMVVAILYLSAPTLTTGALTLSLSVTGLIALPPIALLYTNTGLVVGLVYIGSQLLSTINDSLQEQMHPRRTLDMIMISFVLVICLAANITTLCFGWMALSVIFTVRRVPLALEEPTQSVYWGLVNNIGSVILVMIVAVLAIIEQRTNSWGDVAALPYMVTLLMLAALLRIELFPWPGSHRKGWADRMAALCTGAWLLLRIASVSTQSLPGWNWLVPTIAASSIITALLANLVKKELGMHFMIANLVGVMLLALLLVPVAGTGIAVLGLINMVLVTSLLEQSGEGSTHLQATVIKWQKAAAIFLLMGVPLTLGFLSRWELFRLIGGTDQRSTVILLTMSYTLLTLYLWRQLAWTLRQATSQPRVATSQTRQRIVVNWAVCGLGALFVLIMVILGFIPTSINVLSPVPLYLARVAQSLVQVDITTWIYLISTSLIIPFAGAFFLYYQRSLFRLSSPLFETLRWILGLSWLYFVLGKLLGWLSRMGALVLNGIERRYLLGWVLIWMVIVVAFLVGT
ncbi:MAG: hypothetical protein ACYCZF_11175 [Anaerolineae bacterium]